VIFGTSLVFSCNGNNTIIKSKTTEPSILVDDSADLFDTITTVAGSGECGNGFNGDGGPAISAQFCEPNGVAVDTVGNIYISDAALSCISKVAKATGLISTIAGTCDNDRDYSGDGGSAKSAKFWFTWGVALDAEQNLYIVDYDNNRIRKINATTGIIKTVAGNSPLHDFGSFSGDGGPATLAEFNHPSGVVIDTKGNIYIADQYNERIRKVSTATGVINTVAGNGEMGYSGDGGPAISAKMSPHGIAVDNDGNIYVAEELNNRIRKISVLTGIINTIAGNGESGYSGDGGPAISARLQSPCGVAIDKAGNIYIADWGNWCIRKVVHSTGIIYTIAGPGNRDFLGDGGLARKANLRNPEAVALDGNGNIYVADGYNNRIRKITIHIDK